MNNLPKDMIVKITDELGEEDLINFCKGIEMNRKIWNICNTDKFWIARLKKEFPLLFPNLFSIGTKPKNKYLEIFSRISKISKDIQKEFLSRFGNFSKFLSIEYKDKIYKFFYDLFLVLLKKLEDRIYSGFYSGFYKFKFDEFYEYLPDYEDREESVEYWDNFWKYQVRIRITNFLKNMVSFLKESLPEFSNSSLPAIPNSKLKRVESYISDVSDIPDFPEFPKSPDSSNFSLPTIPDSYLNISLPTIPNSKLKIKNNPKHI